MNTQTFRLYETYTDASNYSGMFLTGGFGGDAIIQATAAGTGTTKNLAIYVGPSKRWVFNTSGHFVAGADNTYDIGSSGALRPRYLYLGGGSLTGTQADSSLTISPTWNTTGTPTAVFMNVTDTTSNTFSLLMDFQVSGQSRFKINKSGQITADQGVNYTAGSGTNQNPYAFLGNPADFGIGLSSSSNLGWFSTAPITGSKDLILTRDAAQTLAQRNGVNAQTSRIYDTYTDASNYRRFAISHSGGDVLLESQTAGTGTAGGGDLIVRAGTGKALTFGSSATSRWQITSGGNFIAQVDNTYDIGASGANRPRNVYAAGSIDAGSNVFAAGRIQAPKLRITDGITAPAATAGFAEIYVDAADGDLKIVFGDGTVKTIVTDT